MNRLVMTFFALALVMVTAYARPSGPPAQSRCNLTEANSPNIRGIKLGMTTEQLLALFPGSGDKADIKDMLDKAKVPASFEAAYLTFDPTAYTSRERFARINAVSVTIYKGRVVEFGVFYIGPSSSGPAWRNVDEWIAKLSEAFSLPGAQEWAAGPNANASKTLRCNGFEVEASVDEGAGSIKLRSLTNLRELQDRMNAEPDRRRREFRP
jgi:hypothetical protein